MRLCFGTYAKILLLCASKDVGNQDIALALFRSVDKSSLMTAPAATGLFNCANGLPNGRGANSLGNINEKARYCDPNLVSSYFASTIIPLISPNKCLQAVYAVRRLIGEDKSIRNDTVVQRISKFTKKDVLGEDNISPPEFLAGVFLYTTFIDNRVGTNTIAFLCLSIHGLLSDH